MVQFKEQDNRHNRQYSLLAAAAGNSIEYMGHKFSPEPKPVDTARIERQKKQRAERLSALGALDCLRNVPPEELESLADLSTFRAFLAHETIIKEEDQDICFYLLLQGSVRLTLRDKDDREVLIGVLDRGDCYGGETLFGDFFRHSGAYAETNCYVLQFFLDDIHSLLPATPTLRETLKRIYQQRLSEFTLARVPLFNQLSPIDRLSIITLLQKKQYPRDTIIVEQGQPGDALYLIESGQVIIERNRQIVATLDEGDFFGEMALLSKKPRSATVQTITPVDVAVLPAAEFYHLLARRPDLETHIHGVIEYRRSLDEALLDDKERIQWLSMAVEHGLLRGSHLLVRTPDRCQEDCHQCEHACGERHGNIRLSVNGVAFGTGQHIVVDTCRQCRIGAECAEACPENAFAWNGKGALIITDACTGCGDCVPACPYDAVDRVLRAPEPAFKLREGSKVNTVLDKTRYAARQWMSAAFSSEDKTYTHRADKCDLCHGYKDLACVSACPTGALRLVPLEEVFPL
jgi:CRP-like cAMP-binding protein/Fe-S-cluster-containing hydrogenase component 2